MRCFSAPVRPAHRLAARRNKYFGRVIIFNLSFRFSKFACIGIFYKNINYSADQIYNVFMSKLCGTVEA